MSAMHRLGFSRLIASQPSRMRDLVVAMVAARILQPDSKLATTRLWNITSLPGKLGVADASEDDLYAAMDWLLEREGRIEKKLAGRHLKNDRIALFDLTSSYFEGVTCPLARRGHNRDGKSGKLQVNYGLLTDAAGRPVSVSVFKGNVGDPKTLVPQVEKIRVSFGMEQFVMIGDRGMITQKQIDVLKTMEGMDWITALRSEGVKKLVNGGPIQMGLFDERNLFEIHHDDYPGERLVACLNHELAYRRDKKRQSLIKATCRELDKVKRMVNKKQLSSKEGIAKRIKSVLHNYRVRKYFRLDIRDDGFEFEIDLKQLHLDVEAYDDDPQRTAKHLATLNRYCDIISKKLADIHKNIHRGRLSGQEKIGVRVGRVINKYKMAKHFTFKISDTTFDYTIDQDKVAAERALDGIYVIRTSLPKDRMTAEDAVRSYKMLAQVERAFRSFKSLDILVRPIYHHSEDRVRAHIFLSMLAYYVQWHMLEAWRPLLFADEDQAAKIYRDPVAPACRSQAALKKVRSKKLPDGTVAHSFQTLLSSLSSIVLNVCRRKSSPPNEQTFEVTTTPTKEQKRALDLIDKMRL